MALARSSPLVRRRTRKVALASFAVALNSAPVVLGVMWVVKPVEWVSGGMYLQGFVTEQAGGAIAISLDELDLRMERRVAIELTTRGVVREGWWWERWSVTPGDAPTSEFISDLLTNRREELLEAIAHELATHPTRGIAELANGPEFSRINLGQVGREFLPFVFAWAFISLLSGIAMWGRWVRRPIMLAASGRCVACEYEIGVSGQATCPECGADISEWMDVGGRG